MKHSPELKNFAADVWTMSFPLKMLGADLRRNVTVIRLSGGKLIIHSTAPFTATDVAAIRELGTPAWLVDVLLRHDTFAAEGSAAFPEVVYLAPPGFDAGKGIPTQPLVPAPPEWGDEIEVLPINGAPSFGEIVMLHRPSRTLIVGDLLINFAGEKCPWTKFLVKIGAVGGESDPGVTRPFKKAITDPAAFSLSMATLLEWDFDRMIVGHGYPILSGAKEKLRGALLGAGIG